MGRTVRIYLDYNATAPVLPDAAAEMGRALREDVGNPSSVHAFGQRAKACVDDARQAVAALLDGDPSEVVFTAGGTEADNLALRGAAEALAASGRRRIVTTGIEHEAVLTTLKALERRLRRRGAAVRSGVLAPGALGRR
jgi:cysteine desulfurase